jgi:arachidonate 15-lipoxygenase
MPEAGPPDEYGYDFHNAKVPGIPMPKELPPAERPTKGFKAVENAMRGRMVASAMLAAVGLRPWRHLEDFARVWRLDPPSPVVRTWSSDTEFARQRLAGMEPLLIRRLADPSKVLGLPIVPQEVIHRQLGSQKSFHHLLSEGRILICDYYRLAGWPLREGRYFVAPIALFAWSDDRPDRPGRLMPLAIRLGQTADDPVFWPDGSPNWQVAKFFVQMADGTHGDMWSHLVQAHFASTPFVIATKRRLRVGHPVRTLLEPHMQFTLRVNTSFAEGPAQFLYRTLMPFTEEGQQRLIQAAWNDWDFERNSYEGDLDRRSLMESPNAKDKVIVDYPYRDDAALSWEATKQYVSTMMEHCYESDSEVANDKELAAWLLDLREDAGVKGLREHIATIEYLKHVVANVIFHFGPKHAAVHSPSADYGIFAPNMSNCAWQPVPKKPEEVMHLMEYLPGRLRSVASFALHYAISEIRFAQFCGYSDGFRLALEHDETPHGWDKARLARADKQLEVAADALTYGLVQAESEIRTRNARRKREVDAEYRFLVPSQIPNSIYA